MCVVTPSFLSLELAQWVIWNLDEYNTQPQDHQISDDNPFKTFGSCHSWMIIDCYHLLFPLMLRKHSGAALSLHLFSNLRSPTGLKCRAVTGGLDSSDRFFLYTAAIKELGTACVCNCFVSSYSFKCMPKVVSSDHNFVWQNFLKNLHFPTRNPGRYIPKTKPEHISFGQQIPNFKIPRNDHLKQHQNS